MKKSFYIFLLLTTLSVCWATTFLGEEVIDPISGKKITVSVMGSTGSYIYQYRSKYDLVFSPYTVPNAWVWFSPYSGYASFGSDFDELKENEKKKIKKWLANNYNKKKQPNTEFEKLAWLEKIYKLRDKDDKFWCHFYRLMAYEHGRKSEEGVKYTRKALAILEKLEKTPLTGTDKIEVLYLLGEYNRRLGNTEKQRTYFEKVKSEKYFDKEDNKEKVGHPYFIDLIKDIKEGKAD